MMRTDKAIEGCVCSQQRFLTGIISTLFLGLERTGKPRDIIREDRDRPSDTVRWDFQQAGRPRPRFLLYADTVLQPLNTITTTLAIYLPCINWRGE